MIGYNFNLLRFSTCPDRVFLEISRWIYGEWFIEFRKMM